MEFKFRSFKELHEMSYEDLKLFRNLLQEQYRDVRCVLSQTSLWMKDQKKYRIKK